MREIERISLKQYAETLDDKQLMNLCKKIANSLRKLPEYKIWSDKKKSKIKKCENCGIEFDDKIVKAETHHSNETLTELVFNTLLSIAEEDKYPIDVLNAVYDLHIKDLVEVQVLCECCHKRHHLIRKTESI